MTINDTELKQYDTFPKLLLRNAHQRPQASAFREKEYGIWQTYSWQDVLENVKALALGLANLGLKRGDKIAIVGSNRPKLYWAFAAAQAIGAVPVPIYQDGVAEEIQYVLSHAEVKAVFAEDQEQVDKIMSIMAECPDIKNIIYKEPRGLRLYDHDYLHFYDDVQEAGRAYEKSHPDFLKRKLQKVKLKTCPSSCIPPEPRAARKASC